MFGVYVYMLLPHFAVIEAGEAYSVHIDAVYVTSFHYSKMWQGHFIMCSDMVTSHDFSTDYSGRNKRRLLHGGESVMKL